MKTDSSQCVHILHLPQLPHSEPGVRYGTQRPYIRTVGESLCSDNLLVVYRNMHIVARFELAVAHMVLFYEHKSGVRFGF